eukprot:scaffold200558_cov31-Tisochrysis_lutea.AAC.1
MSPRQPVSLRGRAVGVGEEDLTVWRVKPGEHHLLEAADACWVERAAEGRRRVCSRRGQACVPLEDGKEHAANAHRPRVLCVLDLAHLDIEGICCPRPQPEHRGLSDTAPRRQPPACRAHVEECVACRDSRRVPYEPVRSCGRVFRGGRCEGGLREEVRPEYGCEG